MTSQSKFLCMFSCEQGQTSGSNGSNIAMKMFWWNYFCNKYYKIITKANVPNNRFVIRSGW